VLRQGPATLLYGMLRMDSGDATDVASRWISSGATHHNALTPGRLDVELEVLCDVLNILRVRVYVAGPLSSIS